MNTLDNWLRSYEQAHADVSRLKQQYLAKVRKADEADDECVILLCELILFLHLKLQLKCEICPNKQWTYV